MEHAFLLILLTGSALIAAGILASPLSSRLGMPVLLCFLGVGMLAGEDGFAHIRFDDVNIAYIVSNMALGVILLDGGMRTKASYFRVGLKPAAMLATLGVVVTAVIMGFAASWILGLPFKEGLLIGAIISSTD
ncbi:MAG TPA: cation:proton antiporter, partial [Hyphomicrobiales bacterium]|nr:cation:proton antiporter [Hyphomicrobiales bacterium]